MYVLNKGFAAALTYLYNSCDTPTQQLGHTSQQLGHTSQQLGHTSQQL